MRWRERRRERRRGRRRGRRSDIGGEVSSSLWLPNYELQPEWQGGWGVLGLRGDRPTPLFSAEGQTSVGEGGGGSRRRGRLHRIQPCTGKGGRYSCEEEERCVSFRGMVGSEEEVKYPCTSLVPRPSPAPVLKPGKIWKRGYPCTKGHICYSF